MRTLASRLAFAGCLVLAGCSEPAPPTEAPSQAPAPDAPIEAPPPIEVPPGTAPDSAPTDAADPQVESTLAAYFEQEGADAGTRHRTARVDLDGDGQDDLLAYLEGPYFCGSGGCSLLVFRNEGGAFTKVASTSVTRSPIAIGEPGPRGWRDLYVTIGGGGGPSGVVHLVDGGSGYPENPSVLPVADALPPEAVVVID